MPIIKLKGKSLVLAGESKIRENFKTELNLLV